MGYGKLIGNNKEMLVLIMMIVGDDEEAEEVTIIAMEEGNEQIPKGIDELTAPNSATDERQDPDHTSA